MSSRSHTLPGWNAVLAALLTAAVLCAASPAVLAQLPTARLNSVFPPGGKPATEFEVTITGADLESADKLHFSHPGITGAVKMRDPNEFEMGKQPVANTFIVKIAAEVPVGRYEVRAVGKYGISNPRAFLVDDLAEATEQEANNTREQAMEIQIGSVTNGRSNGAADTDYFKFQAKKGQRIIIRCAADAIDSRMDPTLVLLDASDKQLETNRDYDGKDPLIDFSAPADGEYFVKLYDFVYGGGNEHFYRLAVSTKPHVDYVLPSVGQPGAKGTFTLFGRNLPGGQDAGVVADGKPLQKLVVQIDVPANETSQLDVATSLKPAAASIDGFEYRLKGGGGASNPVLIGFAAAPVVAEQEPNNDGKQPQKVSIPCEYVGQFEKPRDVDWLQFECKNGEVFWFEITAGRENSLTDPYLLIQRVVTNEKGEVSYPNTFESDDGIGDIGGLMFRTTCDDSIYRFAAPADGVYRVMLRDLYYRGDPRYVYRLSVRKETPDFRLAAVAPFPTNNQNQTNQWSTVVRKGGTAILHVLAFRQDGFNADITVSAENLPPGVTAQPIVLGPNQRSAPLVFTAAEDAKAWAGTIQIVGKAKIGDKEVTRKARGGMTTWAGVNNQAAPARVTGDIGLSVAEIEPAPFQVTLGDGKPLEMSRAGKLEVPVKVARREGGDNNVVLQPRYLVNNLKVGNVTVNKGAKDGKITLEIPNNVPPGTYTFHMLANCQVQYKRNKDLEAVYDAEAKHVAKIAAELAEKSKAAAEAAKKATDEKAAADKAAQDAQANLKKAQDAQKAAQDKANAAKDDKAAQDAAAAAQKAADEAKKTADEAAAKAKAANEAKTKADADAKAADDKNKAAAAAKQAADKKFNDLKNAKPGNVNLFRPTTPVVVKVTEAPVTFKSEAKPAAVKQGAKVEVAVGFNKLYGFDDVITAEIVAPNTVQNLKLNKADIPKGQADGKIVIEAAANATPGDHKLTLRATVKFNGQNLQITQELPLKVEEVKQTAQK